MNHSFRVRFGMMFNTAAECTKTTPRQKQQRMGKEEIHGGPSLRSRSAQANWRRAQGLSSDGASNGAVRSSKLHFNSSERRKQAATANGMKECAISTEPATDEPGLLQLLAVPLYVCTYVLMLMYFAGGLKRRTINDGRLKPPDRRKRSELCARLLGRLRGACNKPCPSETCRHHKPCAVRNRCLTFLLHAPPRQPFTHPFPSSPWSTSWLGIPCQWAPSVPPGHRAGGNSLPGRQMGGHSRGDQTPRPHSPTTWYLSKTRHQKAALLQHGVRNLQG
jgi:hypothetical protein